MGLNKKALSIEIFNGNFFNTENKKKSVKHSPSFRLVNVTAVVSRKNYLVMTSFFVRVINHFITNKHLSRKSSFTTFLYFGSHHRVVGIQFVSCYWRWLTVTSYTFFIEWFQSSTDWTVKTVRAASKLEMALFRQSYLKKKHEYEGFVQELLDLNQNKQR